MTSMSVDIADLGTSCRADLGPDHPPGQERAVEPQPGRNPGLEGALHAATTRLVRSVDALADRAYAEPSLLPGWSRAHVVAHLALNAEALSRAVRGVLAAEEVAMYDSDESRDADIEDLAGSSPTELRSRLLGSTTVLAEALGALPCDALETEIPRTPDRAQVFVAGQVMAMRWHEVEIHHADLDAGYHRTDWPESFRCVLLGRHAERVPATLVATDLGRTWQAGPGTPTVSGTAADLGWWLTGRGDGEGLTTDGTLPRIGAS